MLLDGLLRECQYQVTTTSQVRTALKMLRENGNRFDLIISEVHMPDMDGFKLLELAGLEMNLPVIMLSANDDPNLVMKGIIHGACDCLVKPVRLDDLKNIWQHVIENKKVVWSIEKPTPKQILDLMNVEGVTTENVASHLWKYRLYLKKNGWPQASTGATFGGIDASCIGMSSSEGSGDFQDPSMQKKPRVVWSAELHRKFVAAFNQLGVKKATPQQILDLMNAEWLTREIVASHLQKYRLYLQRISLQQANTVATFGGKDTCISMGSMILQGTPKTEGDFLINSSMKYMFLLLILLFFLFSFFRGEEFGTPGELGFRGVRGIKVIPFKT